MLMYYNRGSRDFPRKPADVAWRYNWEFFAVLSGHAAPYYSETEKLEPSTATLWLLPPRRQFSWWSQTRIAERIVFHFSTVDESLRLLVGERDFLRISLNRREIAQITRIAAEVEPHYQEPKLISSLHFNRALAELSLLIVKDFESPDELITLSTKNQMLAHRALAFYTSQLPHRPLIEEVAQTVNTSATHLRRIFLEVFQHPPKHLFLLAQLDLAKRIASDSNLLISEIAQRSGFVGAPHLCHAFQKYNHVTFNKWRNQISALKTRPHLRKEAFSQDVAPGPEYRG